MVVSLMGVIKAITDKIKRLKNPVSYWRKKGVRIGNNCEVQPKVDFGSEPFLISIGNCVRINNGVQFITHDGGVWVIRHLDKDYQDFDLFGAIIIGNNVHIGNNSIIMPGVTIGDNCIIGCGAIVTKSIPENSIAVGIPARVIESIDDYKFKHISHFVRTKKMSQKEKKSFLLQDASGKNLVKKS